MLLLRDLLSLKLNFSALTLLAWRQDRKKTRPPVIANWWYSTDDWSLVRLTVLVVNSITSSSLAAVKLKMVWHSGWYWLTDQVILEYWGPVKTRVVCGVPSSTHFNTFIVCFNSLTGCSVWSTFHFKSGGETQYNHSPRTPLPAAARALPECYITRYMSTNSTTYEKSAQRDLNAARALAVVRFGHRPPARCHKPTDRTDYNTLRRRWLAHSVTRK